MGAKKRLVDTYKPDSYNVTLSIADDYKAFSGNVEIKGALLEDSKIIRLHSRGLKLDVATVGDVEAAVSFDEETQEVSLALPEQQASGPLEIAISFSGDITERMEGIYPSIYTEKDQDKVIISTQFESTHAREAFPCIDEPEAKATFDLTLQTPKAETVLGNTPIKTQSEQDGRLTTVFETSPIMSTYLIAFAIGDLSSLSGKTRRGTEVNVFATHEQANRLPFSLDVGIRCLEFYEDYFKIDYPLPKLDMIAIPEFAAGAMENWGLVTYRETAMLFDESESSIQTKRRVIEVIAHELAHQWFGNLVTMKWWDDLWLNESFATFMSFECSIALFPELSFDELFMESELFTALHADANSKTTSIYAELEDPKDINEHFDPAITYSKGASVLRMLHNFIGEHAFKDGLHHYLQSHAYNNAVGDDLWTALNKASDKPVIDFMKTWIHKPGYPLVTVSDDSITQCRFYSNPAERAASTDTTRWPISLQSASKLIYFDTEKTDLITDEKLNAGQYGVYRVHYPQDSLDIFASLISQGSMSNVDAMGLLDDTFALMRAGLVSTDAALALTKSYATNQNNAVWDVVASGIDSINGVFRTDQTAHQLDVFVQSLISTQYSRLGWQSKADESGFDTLLRPIVIGLANKFRLADALENSKRKYDDLVVNQKSIDPNLRAAVLVAVARNGNEHTFDQLVKLHDQTAVAEEKRRYAAALCSFEDPALIARAIDLIRSDTVRIQEVISWVFGLYGNRHAREMIWQWQQENWDWIHELFGGGHLYSYFVMGLASFSDETKAKEIETFFSDKDLAGIKRSLEQSVEQIRTKAAWKQRDLKQVENYLKENF